MRALVTGGAGFIGSHLVDALHARGDDVTALDDLSTGARENLSSLEGSARFRLVTGDAASPAVVDPLVERADVVFHLAAAVGVERIVARPVDTIERNVRATEVVCAAAAGRGAPLIFTSTSEVYGKSERLPFREDQDLVLGPSTHARWSYACSKLLDEFLLLAHARERRLPVTILRLFNTVGPRQSGRYGMVLPRFVEAALEGRPISVHGDGQQTRAFCDVADVVRALLLAASSDATRGEILNVGSGEELSIQALAERVRDRLAPAAEIAHIPYERAYGEGFEDMRRRVPDTRKIERLLGWRPRLSLAETIDRVAAHVRLRGVAEKAGASTSTATSTSTAALPRSEP